MTTTTDVTFWPEELQRPLLRAAFLSGDAGRSAWNAWRARVRMDDYPDPGAFRLLPQVCRNVRALGIDDPLLEKLRGIARQSWVKNQRAFGTLAPHLRSLRAAGVDVLVLGGMAMALRCPDHPFEPEAGWSLLVRPEHAVTAIRCLTASGWTATTPPPAALLRAFVAYASTQYFRGPEGQRVDLAWQWLPGHSDDEVWRAADTVEVQNVVVARLAPADHVLYVTAQGTPPMARPLFWRAIDVLLILRAAGGDLDWVRLVRDACGRRLTPWVAETLRYVQETLDGPLPGDVLGRLDATPVATTPTTIDDPALPRPTILHEVARLWSSHRAHSDRLDLGRRLFYFPKYLQYAWRLDRLGQVPRRALASTLYLLR